MSLYGPEKASRALAKSRTSMIRIFLYLLFSAGVLFIPEIASAQQLAEGSFVPEFTYVIDSTSLIIESNIAPALTAINAGGARVPRLDPADDAARAKARPKPLALPTHFVAPANENQPQRSLPRTSREGLGAVRQAPQYRRPTGPLNAARRARAPVTLDVEPANETSARGSTGDRTSLDTASNAGGRAASDASRITTPSKTYVDGIYVIDKNYLLSFPQTAWRFFTGPSRFGRRDWWTVGAVLGGAGILLALDGEIRDFWQDNIRSGTSKDILDIFEPAGNFFETEVTALGLYGAAELLDQTGLVDLKREKGTALLVAESIVLSELLTDGLKFLSGRERPDQTNEPYDFDGPGNAKESRKSFPSGHATTAFAIATTISETYGEAYPWVPWFTYAWATGTALSRINNNDHWASDVFIGGLVGYAVGKTVTGLAPFLEKYDVSMRPLRHNTAQGAALNLRF
jgi:membrane-associated phospholipid phosphatase